MKTIIDPSPAMSRENRMKLNDLVSTIRELRGPQGCPWDRKQTTLSLKKYLHSEFQELVSAIDNNDSQNICEELGDLLFLIVMISEIHREAGEFDLNRVIEGIDAKLIRRHPHVFEEKKNLSEEDLNRQWDAIKAAEKSRHTR